MQQYIPRHSTYVMLEMFPQFKEAYNQIVIYVKKIVSLDVRDDSRLVWSFIIGQLPEWSEEMIATQLACIHYLYNYTDYTHRLQQHPYSNINALQNETLARYGIPEVWPWQICKYVSLN